MIEKRGRGVKGKIENNCKNVRVGRLRGQKALSVLDKKGARAYSARV